MIQKTYIFNIADLEFNLQSIISDNFNLDENILPKQIRDSLGALIDNFNKNISVLVETPYVDRIFRDSYYLYYSSKYGRYSRDCIKVSLFQEEIKADDFRTIIGYERLQKKYLGFFIIRPTEPDYLGRNVISPIAFNYKSFNYCSVNTNATANGLKFSVKGFPHSSQDGETYTCAETTIWALMEYFGSKYPDYRPIKPSEIHSHLKNLMYERHIPSKGLTIQQISFLLKGMGFGCRIYSSEQYGEEFYRLLSCYVESGIPLAVGMDDFDEKLSNKIGHAVLIIGNDSKSNSDYISIKPNVSLNRNQLTLTKKKSISIYDLDDAIQNFVFIDDNHPPYRIVSAQSPTIGYEKKWANVKIKHFIVPLYPKIYLEAFEAKNFIKEFLLFGPNPLEMMQQVFIKFYLSSSRSFKHSLALSNMTPDLKNFILEKPMPKFVWIAEIASRHSLIDNKATGIIVLDATEPSISDNKPLLVAAYQNNLVFFDGNKDILKKIALTLHPFNRFLNNLTHSSQ